MGRFARLGARLAGIVRFGSYPNDRGRLRPGLHPDESGFVFLKAANWRLMRPPIPRPPASISPENISLRQLVCELP